jgi:HD-GYP domain-containing protein (c-di-GMP phosphodiesterase class II)
MAQQTLKAHPQKASLLQAVEEIAEHHLRVRTLVRVLCETIGMAPSRDLEVAAGLHDTGKLALLQVVSSTAPLTPTEWAMVQLHPHISAAILAAAGLQEAARIVIAHHERWDGQGYPSGLRGEEIPLEARILAVADTLAALLEQRPYRPSPDPARELAAAAGTQLDPEVARAGLLLLDRLPP